MYLQQQWSYLEANSKARRVLDNDMNPLNPNDLRGNVLEDALVGVKDQLVFYQYWHTRLTGQSDKRPLVENWMRDMLDMACRVFYLICKYAVNYLGEAIPRDYAIISVTNMFL